MPDPITWLTRSPAAWPAMAAGVSLGAGVMWAAQAWLQSRGARAHHPDPADAARYSAIVESAPDALITVDEQQRIVLFNQAAECMLACKASEAVGSSLSRFIPPELQESHGRWMTEFGHASVVNKLMSSGRDIEAIRTDGSRVRAEATIARLIDPLWPGGAQLYTVSLRDISQRKQAREEPAALTGGASRPFLRELDLQLTALRNELAELQPADDPAMRQRYSALTHQMQALAASVHRLANHGPSRP